MILKFIFRIESSGIIEKILMRVAKQINVKLGLSRDLRNLYAYVQGDEDQIDSFSRELSVQLPLSIFLKSLDAEIVEEFKDDLLREFPERNVPPCPKCLQEVKNADSENYYNPFHSCEVCGYKNAKISVKEETTNYKQVFEKLAEKLKNEGKIFIQTMNGKYEVSTTLENAEQVVAVDLSAVATYFMSFDGDAKALGSIEKPLVNLKTNLTFKKEFGISTPSYFVKLPDCMVLELLCEEIKNDIKLLSLRKSDNNEDFAFELINNDILPIAVVTDTKNHDILLQSGDRGILPLFEKGGFAASGKNSEYAAVCDSEKCIIKKEALEASEANKPFAGFFGVLKQWELEDKVIFGYSFYEEDENKIFVNSPKFGLIEYIDFNFKFASIEEVFASIRAMNETGVKLVENYAKKQPENFENAIKADLTTNKKSIAYLWGIMAIILGVSDNIDEGYKKILKLANSAMTKKGPRIDYKMQKNNLDPLWAIRTAMSFKLAGVDNYLLSFGIIESFAEFLTNAYDDFDKETPLDGAVIVGDLFKGEFLNKIYTSVKKNHNVYTPKALPISGAVEAYGSAVINSKQNS